MRRSISRTLFVLAAVAVALPTTGCQFVEDLRAQLFGRPAPVAAVPAPPPPPAPKPTADRIVVFKSRRLLELQRGGKTFETFAIALGPHSVGTKHRQGDERTPEGVYYIDGRSTDTPYTRELHISYPNAQDRERARAAHVDPGGGIFIHGLPRDFGPYDPPVWVKDWTEGCIAVGNAAIVKVWDAVPDGTPIDIEP